jgi:cytochrome oxidase Cu insertion factor (SCO1/SenC/PrrC family)
MLRFIRYLSLFLLALVALGWSAVWLAARQPDGLAGRTLHQLAALVGIEPDDGNGGISSRLQLGGPFVLVNGQGATVTDQSWPGKWKLVYFGYTYCPDVCPTELQTISAALDRLGDTASQVVPIFITVDPERDTPAAMADYVKLFDDRLVGLTGTPEQIAAVARRYRVYYSKVQPKGASAYLMDHSSFVYLMAPDGSFRALFRQGSSADEIADAIAQRLHGGS